MKIADLIIEHISKDEIKDKVVKELNDNVNIPIIGENTEKKMIEAIYEATVAVLRKVL